MPWRRNYSLCSAETPNPVDSHITSRTGNGVCPAFPGQLISEAAHAAQQQQVPAAAVWSWVLHPNGSCDTLSLLAATWCTNKEPKPSQLLSRTSLRARGVHAGCTRVSCGGASGVLRLEIANGKTPHAIWGSSAVGSLGEPGRQPRAA